MNNAQAPWKGIRERQHRPPDRRIGLLSIAVGVLIAGVSIGLWLIGEPGDGGMGPWVKTLFPVFGLLLAVSGLLSGLSDLRPASDHQQIVRLRMLSTVVRFLAFAVWGVVLVGFLLA